MSRSLWLVTLLKLGFPGRFLLARLTRASGLGPLVDHWLFAGDHLVYLPRDRVIPIGQPLGPPGQVVLPSQVVEHFIEQAGYHWIMDTCICRSASHCRDYPLDLGCLFLGQAALGINPKLGRRVTKEEARAHVRKAREAGLVHLVGRNKLDTVWLGVGPGTRLLTICHCCPCCCLWRMLPQIAPEIGDKVKRMPGVQVRVSDACTGCGTCTKGVCFVDAIRLREGRTTIGEACRGCGRCVDRCPHGAIELTIEDGEYVAETIRQIVPLVDVT